MKQYEKLALIYDKMIEIDYDKWRKFLEAFAKDKNLNFRHKKALELACGTGNMTLKLKELAMDVISTDLSSNMLAIADEKLSKNRYKVKFLKQNMIDYNIPGSYEFIFSFCDGYNYITGEEELRKSFEKVYNSLNNKGYFIFDISTKHKLESIIGNNTFTYNEEELCYIWDNYLTKDILEMYITFFVKEEDGKLYERFTEKHTQKLHEIDHLTHLLNNCGFKKIEIYDDYNYIEAELKTKPINNITKDSMRATIIAYKEEE